NLTARPAGTDSPGPASAPSPATLRHRVRKLSVSVSVVTSTVGRLLGGGGRRGRSPHRAPTLGHAGYRALVARARRHHALASGSGVHTCQHQSTALPVSRSEILRPHARR